MSRRDSRDPRPRYRRPHNRTVSSADRSTAALRSAAPLLSELRWFSAKSAGADSELSFDSDEVTGASDASNVASGERESARSAAGMVDITGRPADSISGAARRVRLMRPPQLCGASAPGGEPNGVTAVASAQARA